MVDASITKGCGTKAFYLNTKEPWGSSFPKQSLGVPSSLYQFACNIGRFQQHNSSISLQFIPWMVCLMAINLLGTPLYIWDGAQVVLPLTNSTKFVSLLLSGNTSQWVFLWSPLGHEVVPMVSYLDNGWCPWSGCTFHMLPCTSHFPAWSFSYLVPCPWMGLSGHILWFLSVPMPIGKVFKLDEGWGHFTRFVLKLAHRFEVIAQWKNYPWNWW